MKKRCECGHAKNLHLRTVIYARKVNIARVPVFCCSSCGSCEVHPGVKSEIGRLIRQFGPDPMPRTILFDRINELAGVLSSAIEERADGLQASDIARATEERTNELLDLWLIASSLKDEAWKAELQERLSQLSTPYISS